MSQVEVERFLGRILTDADFRRHAERSLEKACYSKGFIFSPIELSFMRAINFELFQEVSETLDDSIRRS